MSKPTSRSVIIYFGSSRLSLVVLTILGIVGVANWRKSLHWSSGTWTLILCAGFLIVFVAGAYRLWDETDKALKAAEKDLAAVRDQPRQAVHLHDGSQVWGNLGGGIVFGAPEPQMPQVDVEEDDGSTS